MAYLRTITQFMKYQLYKPNAKNTGCAMGFSIGYSKDNSPSLFVSTVLQSGWNDQTKKGSFAGNAKDPNKSSNFKMNANEAGEMISSIRTRVPIVFFHKFNEDNTIISFSPWDKDRKIKGPNGDQTYKSAAFGLSFSKNSSQQFKIALEAGETEVLSLLLQEFIRQDLEFQKNKQGDNNQESAPVSRQPEKKQENAADDWDDSSHVPF